MEFFGREAREPDAALLQVADAVGNQIGQFIRRQQAEEALRESEAQFRQLAQYDTLTQLPNRALFYDRLAQALAQAQRNGFTLAVMFVDLDRFKYINDTYGHAAGDLLLKEISRRLSECVRRNDTVGRLSGDEFAVVLSRLTAAEDAATVAQKIVAALNLPVALGATQVDVTASIGITVFPGDSTDQESLLSNADIAMYRAKEGGRNNYQFYTPELHRRARAMLSMEAELRRALEREEFVLHYQPRVSLTSGRITGVEALLRWHHPERGLVQPAEFIVLLEETGLVLRAGEWVLKSVCEQIKAWELAGIVAVPVAINLSARQFLVPDIAEIIRRELDAHQIRAALIEVEFVESAVMKDVEDAIVKLSSLRTLGVQTTVDDFGTGYSSLGYLTRFSLRGLKIDRSFVRDITVDADGAIVTQAVIAMAHKLNLKVIAQGVETQNQLSFLERHGCDEVQGYLYSRAVCAAECGALIRGGEIKPGPGAVFT
jgi:diguanylate cyclase (GGDEF)-like protein